MSEQDDEYLNDRIADVLKQEAKDISNKYSSLGIQAFTPKRPTGSAPKPNTRFLRHIIRETDNHNAALLAKEKDDALERRRKLERNSTRHRSRRFDRSHHDHESQEEYEDRRRKRRKRDQDADTHRIDLYKRNRRHRSRSRSASPRHELSNGDRDRKDHRRPKAGNKEHHSHRKRENESDEHLSKRDHQKHAHHQRKGQDYNFSTHDESRFRSRRKEPKLDKYEVLYMNNGNAAVPKEDDGDSDPLDDIIGPEPASREPKVRSKGRGAFKDPSRSEIDSHFSSAYNPSLDVQADPDTEDDWEQALEALRDRQKWRQQGAERLKSAGFSDEQIKKWEKGGEKDESDVTWTKQGQGREWDRGKVVGDDGTIDLKPSWARTFIGK